MVRRGIAEYWVGVPHECCTPRLPTLWKGNKLRNAKNTKLPINQYLHYQIGGNIETFVLRVF
jgi:hypothetical protein